jgi:hypothetical protein
MPSLWFYTLRLGLNMMAIHCLLPATVNQCSTSNLLGRMPTTDTTDAACLASTSTSVLVSDYLR